MRVAGRIRDSDIAQVRDRNRIDEVVGEYVALRRAGGGALKGLCPFHDEKTPSFNVRPTHGTFHCFGCGEGGDVIAFVMKIDHLGFVEAVERLADRVGIQLTYEGGGTASSATAAPAPGWSTRTARRRSSTPSSCARRGAPGAGVPRRARVRPRWRAPFGCGYAPSGWDRLTKHLLGRGFVVEELVQGGAVPGGPARPDRPVPPPAAVADQGPRRRRGRLRRAPAVRRRPDRGEVPQHRRDADLQEVAGAVRARPGQAGDRPAAPGRRGRGLHRRDGHARCRACRPPSPPAARRSARSTSRCCAGC